MRALVTGASGFLGRHVVAALRARGHAVRAMVRPGTSVEGLGWDEGVEVLRVDLRVEPALAACFDDVDVLVHLAAQVLGSDDAQFVSTAVATERLLEAMASTGTRKVVLAGSFAVYDWVRADGVLDEDTPLESSAVYERGGYAVAKLWQERVAERLARANDWALVVLRPGFIWGEGHTFIPGMGWRLGPVQVVLGLDRVLPLTHVENCADAFVLAAERDVGNAVLNVVDTQLPTAWDFTGEWLRRGGIRRARVTLPFAVMHALARVAEWVSRRLFGPRGKLPTMLMPRRLAMFKPLWFSNTRLRRALGWEPRLGLEAALDRSFAGAARPSTDDGRRGG
ncbi:MAG: NAD(P)-dependent oxidoreductase [Ectothiorhodospiraceae bacterium]|nr:NAD(P)-dependent oxidoreductase [Ectothiorhodospiraceae bacterium]